MVLVLTSGFAVSTAIFSAVRSVLLAPLPYSNPERLVQIISQWPKTGDKNGWSFFDSCIWFSLFRAAGSDALGCCFN